MIKANDITRKSWIYYDEKSDFPIQNIPFSPPVTLTIGSPIIQVPGCVVFNPANEKSIKLVTEDDRGNRALCDGTVPYFFPMDYVPEDLVFVEDVAAPNVTPAP